MDFKSLGGADETTLLDAEGGLQRRFEKSGLLGHTTHHERMAYEPNELDRGEVLEEIRAAHKDRRDPDDDLPARRDDSDDDEPAQSDDDNDPDILERGADSSAEMARLRARLADLEGLAMGQDDLSSGDEDYAASLSESDDIAKRNLQAPRAVRWREARQAAKGKDEPDFFKAPPPRYLQDDGVAALAAAAKMRKPKRNARSGETL